MVSPLAGRVKDRTWPGMRQGMERPTIQSYKNQFGDYNSFPSIGMVKQNNWGLTKLYMICRRATRGWAEPGLPNSVLNPSLLETSMASKKIPVGHLFFVPCFDGKIKPSSQFWQ